MNLFTKNLKKWNFHEAFFFAGTIATTIGYGKNVPVTAAGKYFCMVFVIIGNRSADSCVRKRLKTKAVLRGSEFTPVYSFQDQNRFADLRQEYLSLLIWCPSYQVSFIFNTNFAPGINSGVIWYIFRLKYLSTIQSCSQLLIFR